MRHKIPEIKAGPLADREAIERTLQSPDLEQRARLTGELLIDLNPVSPQELCAEIGKIMRKYQWYSERPRPSRNPDIDKLVEEGLSLYKIGLQVGRSAGYVSAYLHSRGLDTYWRWQKEQRNNPKHSLEKELRAVGKPLAGEEKTTLPKKIKRAVKPIIRNERGYQTYNHSCVYMIGEKLYFPDIGSGEITSVTPERITVSLDNKTRREFRHGLEDAPSRRRNSY